MKKIVTVLVLLVLVGAGAFAIGLSVGVGASASSASGNFSSTFSGTAGTAKSAITQFGAKAFLDATYAQLSVGYVTSGSVTVSGTSLTTTSYSETLSYLTLGGLLKYPFKVGPVTLFPLLGVEYDLNLVHGATDYFEPRGITTPITPDFNQFWIKGGVGADISLGKRLYIRPEALYGIKLLNSAEQAYITQVQQLGATNVSAGYSTLDFSLLLGYKL